MRVQVARDESGVPDVLLKLGPAYLEQLYETARTDAVTVVPEYFS